MKSIKTIILLVSFFIFTHCKTEEDPTFKITTNAVGKLDKKSLARDLDLIFEKDSVVRDTVQSNFGNGSSKIRIYEKGGPLLLTLTPNTDSIPTIQNVLINDQRYKTEKGIHIESTFKDIQEKYEIKKIITSINNVVILLKNSDIYFTIDKAELPDNLRYKANTNIEAVQIPDTAKIKYMMVGWD